MPVHSSGAQDSVSRGCLECFVGVHRDFFAPLGLLTLSVHPALVHELEVRRPSPSQSVGGGISPRCITDRDRGINTLVPLQGLNSMASFFVGQWLLL